MVFALQYNAHGLAQSCVNAPSPTLPFRLACQGDVLLLGDVYHREETDYHRLRDRLRQMAPKALRQMLLTECWGNFVCVIPASAERPHLEVLRSPFGTLDCFTAVNDAQLYIFSDLALARELGLSVTAIDWTFVRQSLVYANLAGDRTGLTGISQILPGFSGVWQMGCLVQKPIWSPWPFTDRNRQFRTLPEATFALRQSLNHTLSRITDGLPHAFIELSGGLDSSIIAGCLAGRGFPLTALNLITPVPGADERVYARDVSTLSNIDTCYEELDIESVEAIVEPKILHPLPGMEMLQAAVDSASVAHFKPTRADALFTGAGGDSVLCYLSTAGSAADALLTFGVGRRFWSALHDLCSLYNITLWKGARLVLKKVFAKRPVGWKADRRFLSDAATTVLPFDHPWLARPSSVPPGKAQHALETLSSKFFIEGMGRRYAARVHLPLLCQPVVETCLRIPTWMWTDQGHNRAVARYAFADRLPDRVRLRRSKGNFVGYYGQIYERARDQLRLYLCEGELATAGLIDVAALNTYLKQPIAKRDREFQRVFELARMESWLRSTKRMLDTPT